MREQKRREEKSRKEKIRKYRDYRREEKMTLGRWR